MLYGLLALLLVQRPDDGAPHVAGVEETDLGRSLSGSDFVLIAEAARHREMRGKSLSCYSIYVYAQGGQRRVAFVEARDRMVERQTATGTEIIYLPPDPNCRSISFEMRSDGRVGKVIRSRH